jgi:hypothetical protein
MTEKEAEEFEKRVKESMEEELRLNPGYAYAIESRGILYQKKGDYDSAKGVMK